MNDDQRVYPKILFEDETQAHVICGHCPATVSPQVAERSKAFNRRIYEFGQDTFAAIEYGGSSVMVVGPEGAVIVGTLSHIKDGDLVAGHYNKLRDGTPIKAIIYNDNLVDNYGGVESFVDEKDVKSGDVTVIAHENFERMLKGIGDIGNIMIWRAAYQVGGFLETGPEGNLHSGAVAVTQGKISYIAPNLLVDKSWKGELGGIKVEIYHMPAESDDGIVTYFPEQKTLVVGHVLFGDMLPQIYAQRGIVRCPKRWYKGIEDLIDLVNSIDVEYMVPMHFMEPIVGRKRIMEVLTVNRDTLQFVADQAARYINKGYRPNDLANAIELPPHLVEHPDLQEHYGRLQQHLRQQFYDLIGWFEGDPTFLDPLSDHKRADLYIEAFGGKNSALAKVEKAMEATNYLWAAEILNWIILNAPENTEAKKLKAQCMRQLGYAAPNATYRSWFLTSALELEGRLPQIHMEKSMMIPEKVLSNLSPIEQVETLKARLKAEKTFELEVGINLHFDNDPNSISVIIRRGVLVTKMGELQNPDVNIKMHTNILRDLVENHLEAEEALSQRGIVIEKGDKDFIIKLGTLFEPAAAGNFPVALPSI